MGKVCIIGSLNMDMVIDVKDLPVKGETILAGNFKRIPGGKGANQAVAAQRLGADVYMIGKVGKDDIGETLINNLKIEGINTEYIFSDESNPTGLAFIPVDENGNNCIIVVSGANMNISLQEIKSAEAVIKSSNVIVTQFEIDQKIIIEAFRIAKKYGITTILNPAPARDIPAELLENTRIIIPNEIEAYEITKIRPVDEESVKKACNKLLNKGVEFVIITLGENGAAVASKNRFELIPAYKVTAVDTTAAGDGFIGAIASRLHGGFISFEEIRNAVEYGNKVSSIVVQRQGAQPSLPYMDEIKLVENTLCIPFI
jgi:ribokinase